MKKITGLFLVMATLVAFSPRETAAEEKTDRKGFLIGFDVGGGAVRFGDDGTHGALLGGLKIGGGITERILLMYEETSSVGLASNLPSLSTGLLSAQFFVLDSYYVRPGVGFGWQERDVAGGGTLLTDLGFTAGLAVGREWRLTRRFALSPEAKFGYARIEGHSDFSYGAAVDLRWYF